MISINIYYLIVISIMLSDVCSLVFFVYFLRVKSFLVYIENIVLQS